MISQTAEYALRAIVCLAVDRSAPKTTATLVMETGVPPGYLPKVMLQLGRVDLVTSQRGMGGGYYLKPRPCDITLWEVVNSFGPGITAGCCPLGCGERSGGKCAMHLALERALHSMEEVLSSTTIADLLDGSLGPAPLGIDLSATGQILENGL